jgi:sugar lactone lactonase YvrE
MYYCPPSQSLSTILRYGTQRKNKCLPGHPSYSRPRLTSYFKDVEGHIWHACFSGSKVIRISPEGKVVGEVLLPTRCITCVAFVGTEIYITSAEEPDPEKFPDSAKFGGNVFRVDVGVEGLPKHKAKLS